MECGKDPDGGAFLTVRLGAGLGGGVSLSGGGRSVDYVRGHGIPAITMGLYSKAGAGVGPLKVTGADNHVGYSLHYYGAYGWGSDSFEYGPVLNGPGVKLDPRAKGLSASASAGFEASIAF